MPPDAAAAVDAVYRSDWGRIVATLIGWSATSTWPKRRRRKPLRPPSTSGATPACPSFRAPGSSRRPGTRPSTASGAADAVSRRSSKSYGAVVVQPDRRGAGLRHQRDPRRSAAADLHLLPPGAGARGAGRADAAHAGRPRDRRDRARVSRAGDDDGAAAGAGEAQDSRRRHSVRRARHERHAGAARRRADRDLSGLQRRLRADARRAAGADRPLRRGHPPGPPGADADGAAAARKRPRCSR